MHISHTVSKSMAKHAINLIFYQKNILNWTWRKSIRKNRI